MSVHTAVMRDRFYGTASVEWKELERFPLCGVQVPRFAARILFYVLKKENFTFRKKRVLRFKKRDFLKPVYAIQSLKNAVF